VTGVGTLTRVVPTSATINVPSTSQFYNKTVQHEQVHLNHWQLGPGHLFGDLFIVNDFFNQIRNLTGDGELDLLVKIRNVKISYLNAQAQAFQARYAQDESEAYAVSDAIAPLYLYQGSCQGSSL
jgi:hypothetical protein